MMNFGLLGRKLGHSYSPQIHARLGEYSYRLFPREPGELEAFFRDPALDGCNVTMPYKKDVIPYLDELTDTAEKLGAVNTVVRRKDGTLLGHNTDCYGFRSLLQRSGLETADRKVLVLGSGGASNTVVEVLRSQGARPVVISRTGENNYGNLSSHKDAVMIVNTTPVGMYPNTGTAPLSLDGFPRLQGVLDVVYNPARTQLLLDAEARGIPAFNGLWMLVAQAKESAEYFTGNQIPDCRIEQIHTILSRQMQNIILIGMPGCGKSTVGQLVADLTRREFLDADQQVCQLAGKAIPEIFSQDGERAFRELETQVLRRLGSQSGLVIATGGGCVTRPENYPLLHQNGILFWLRRDLPLLSTEGRPLSQAGRLDDMLQIRRPLYEAFSDHTVSNNAAPEESARQILSLL